MPEISSTLYPIVGVAAIAILLLLVVVARRRRTNRDQADAEGEGGFPVAADESLGVKLVKDDRDAHGSDDTTPGRDEGDGRVVNGVNMTGASSPETTGSRSDGAGSRGLVAWGPHETGPEKPRTEDEQGVSSPEANPSATEAGAPAAASHSAGWNAPSEPPPEAEVEAAGTTPAERHSPDSAGLVSTVGIPEGSAGPEGQPFERDGSWWFRRDGELLVYDDATSEWKAAPETGPASPATGPAVTAADVEKAARGESPGGGATTAILERGPLTHEGPLRPRSEGATSWKCRTCGATNGSAATGCRMCFSARP